MTKQLITGEFSHGKLLDMFLIGFPHYLFTEVESQRLAILQLTIQIISILTRNERYNNLQRHRGQEIT